MILKIIFGCTDLELFDLENSEMGHALLKHNKEHIINAYADKSLLAWDFFVWLSGFETFLFVLCVSSVLYMVNGRYPRVPG